MPDIILPADKPTRDRGSFDAPNFISIHDAESRALGTGQHRGMTVEFSDDGQKWSSIWMPTGTGDHRTTHPELARATVKRRYAEDDIVQIPVTIRWDEYVPDLDSPRRADWDKMPTVMLGKCAKMSAYRGTFHDVIGNAYAREEFDHIAEVTA